MTLSACADDHSAGSTTAVAKAPVAKRAARAGARCPAAVGSFVDSLAHLRSKLALGLSYETYLEDVRQVRSSYDKIPVDDLLIDCLAAVGTPGEKALDQYVGAANMWGECLSEVGCDSYSIEPRLQRRWRVASHYVSDAQRGLGTRR